MIISLKSVIYVTVHRTPYCLSYIVQICGECSVHLLDPPATLLFDLCMPPLTALRSTSGVFIENIYTKSDEFSIEVKVGPRTGALRPPLPLVCNIYFVRKFWLDYTPARYFYCIQQTVFTICIFFSNFTFRNYLPLKKSVALHLSKLESLVSKNDVCKVLVKLAQWSRRRFLNIFNIILHFCYYPLLKNNNHEKDEN